jgi:pyruvate,water dikinase
MLSESELDEWLVDPSSFRQTLADREQIYLSLFDYIPPFMVNGEVPAHEKWDRVSERGEFEGATTGVITGAPGSSGKVVGRARIVKSAMDIDELEPGEVLVAAITDPSWTPLFLTSAAVVTEVGGIFSHGPIVCRELGTPCVVAAVNACRLIPDGALIEVDGSAGTVTILEA